MKAKLLQNIKDYPAGTELELVDIFCGYETSYICILPNGNYVSINTNMLEITDYTPFIDWKQRRYEIAKEMMPVAYQESRNILLRGGNIGYNDVAEAAVEFADMLIEELKKRSND